MVVVSEEWMYRPRALYSLMAWRPMSPLFPNGLETHEHCSKNQPPGRYVSLFRSDLCQIGLKIRISNFLRQDRLNDRLAA